MQWYNYVSSHCFRSPHEPNTVNMNGPEFETDIFCLVIY